MKSALTAATGALLGTLLWSATASADCHYQKQTYPEASTVCRGAAQFQCGPLGAWKKLEASCPRKPDDEQAQNPVDKPAGKETDNSSQKPQDNAP